MIHAAFALATLLSVARPDPGAEPEVPLEVDVDIEEKLNAQVPKDLPFVDSTGKQVKLGDYFQGRPVVLALVYYRCPVLCGLLLGGVAKLVQQLDWKLGQEYDIVTVSIDPHELPKLAAEKRTGFLQAAGYTDPATKWAFLTGKVDPIDELGDAIGYKFRYVDGQRQFAHVAALFVLTPEGRVSRYLYGVNFDVKQAKLALFEAADGRVGTTLEKVLLRCYRYDPAQKKYSSFLTAYFRIGGLVLLAVIGGFLGLLWRRDLKRAKA